MAIRDLLTDYFRCPPGCCSLEVSGDPIGDPGFFRFGDAVCYGQPCAGESSSDVTSELYDVAHDVRFEGSKCLVSFDPSDVVENLRRERYVPDSRGGVPGTVGLLMREGYYLLRPWLRVSMRRYLQRFFLQGRLKTSFPAWPVDRSVEKILQNLMRLALQNGSSEKIPFIWFWPQGKSGCVVMTHDVETSSGLEFCPSLMDINDSYQVKASFQLIPGARYNVSREILDQIWIRGHEVNVHDWSHDGHLFSDHGLFLEKAAKINQSAKEFRATGFRSGALYRNSDWYDALAFAYDMSIPNVGHLDPQAGGCCTVMPYFIGHILEIPVTTTQDYSLFHILGDYSIDLWRRQLGLILESNGLASFIVHPDYILEKSARATYVALLECLSQLREEQNVWLARPGEVNAWWRSRCNMRLVHDGSEWRIEGPGKEQARVAYATLKGNDLTYAFAEDRAAGRFARVV